MIFDWTLIISIPLCTGLLVAIIIYFIVIFKQEINEFKDIPLRNSNQSDPKTTQNSQSEIKVTLSSSLHLKQQNLSASHSSGSFKNGDTDGYSNHTASTLTLEMSAADEFHSHDVNAPIVRPLVMSMSSSGYVNPCIDPGES